LSNEQSKLKIKDDCLVDSIFDEYSVEVTNYISIIKNRTPSTGDIGNPLARLLVLVI
jgi:hypothetical protein